MNNMTLPLKQKKGFTLIELLVVIAIIALLLSIIMPAYTKIKLVAKEVLCKSNIRQYGIATELYTNENNNFLPNPWKSLYSEKDFTLDGGSAERYCRWHDARFNLGAHADEKDKNGKRFAGPYWQYLANVKANVCPTFASFKEYGDMHQRHQPTIPIEGPNYSYSMNGNLTKHDSSGNSTDRPLKKTEVTNTAGTFLWGEENMWPSKDPDGNKYCDYALNDNALAISDSTLDSFGNFHGLSGAEIEAISPKDAGGYGLYDGKGFTMALMFDGSIEKVTPEQNFLYAGKKKGY